MMQFCLFYFTVLSLLALLLEGSKATLIKQQDERGVPLQGVEDSTQDSLPQTRSAPTHCSSWEYPPLKKGAAVLKSMSNMAQQSGFDWIFNMDDDAGPRGCCCCAT